MCFDKDHAGEIAAQGIARMIERQYEIRYTPPELGKDYNEQLMAEKGLSGVKTRKSKINIIQEEVSR